MKSKVHELMTRNPVAASPDWTLGHAVGVMGDEKLRHLPVVERGRLVGVVSERDLLEATGWNPDRYVDADGAPKVVRDSMSVPVETAQRDDDLAESIARLDERRIGCLPVVDGAGRLEGILTVADVLAEYARASGARPGAGPLDGVVAGRMSGAPITALPTDTVEDALATCRSRGVRHLPVVTDGWFVGLVSDRDLRLRAGRGELQRSLADVMTTELVAVGPESLVSDAADRMLRRRIDSVAVTRDGGLVGMLTTTDVLRRFAEALQGVRRAPRDA